ncbi:non-structural maintenance of chromosomes element 4 homolog B isoform X1 [Sorghum bicolor]|nr:non-structural maintenance of chromosomes element 4 homolog B isoform X1 [Sorghum bicolor]|eukprot:XP_002445898.1 non-structural maintenance of chromosomes element 4 homolog B isoform X1 [Sorghum bicolor]
MEDRAAAAGSGEGGRDREDALWKGLAPLSSQSIEERRALRSEYAGVRAMIREDSAEVKGDPTLGHFDAALNKIEKLHEKVQRPMEQLADAEALLDLGNALVSSTKLENSDGPTPSEFITALISKFGAKASPTVDSNGSFSWSSLGCAVSGLFMPAAGCQTMNGPMGLGLAVKERRQNVRRQSRHLGSEPAVPDELAPDRDERNDTDKSIAVMFNLLRSHSNRNVKLEHLILNRQSFAQTVENIFALSFLVKDGRAEIYVADNGDHFVAPRNAPSAGSIASREVVNSQFVFRFDTEDWRIMKGMVNPGEELMPHRSSYHGGEYKTTTQSCSAPDCSKLASHFEHPEEGGFVKEDPEEFTEDEEAMKLDLVKCCSRDGGLKEEEKATCCSEVVLT